jgi:TolB protein
MPILALLGLSSGLVVWSLLTLGPVHAQEGRGQTSKTAHLLFIGNDGRLLLRDPSGKEEVLADDVSTDIFRYPSPSPDGRSLAYIASDDRGYALYSINLAGGDRRELYRSQTEPPLYMVWSPDSRYIAFLVNLRTGSLAAHLVASDGSHPSELIAPGNPSYFAWAPDSSALLLHIGGSVFEGGSLLLYRPSGTATPLFDDPGLFFRTPSWSADGKRLLYVAQKSVSGRPTIEDVESVITSALPDGSDVKTLVRQPKAALFFARSPKNDNIAYIKITPGGDARLELFDEALGKTSQLSDGRQKVAGFFWSPDGNSIAYLTLSPVGDDLIWNVVNLVSGELRELASFEPNDSFYGLLNFFDAYALTLSLWSSDGTRLTYATTDGVYVLDVATGTATRAVEGMLGMWLQK